MTTTSDVFTLRSGFLQPHSLHPKIILQIHRPHNSSAPSPYPFPPPSCTLHALVLLNDKLFLDPYELQDVWSGSGLESGADKEGEETFVPTGWLLIPPVPDLERPVRYGFRKGLGDEADEREERIIESQLYIRYEGTTRDAGRAVGDQKHDKRASSWSAEIPTHARYQQPHESGYRDVEIGSISSLEKSKAEPMLSSGQSRGLANDIDVSAILACQEALLEATAIQHHEIHPLFLRHLNSTSLSLPYIYPIQPHSTTLNSSPSTPSITSRISLPTAIPSHQPYISAITLLVVLGCTVSILKTLWDVWWKGGMRGGKSGEGGRDVEGEGKKDM